jgi:nucleolar protein 16
MGRELQKRKNRSSRPKVRQKTKSKKLNVTGNALVAANWDQSQTLRQNYQRLGLTVRLNAVSGGREPLSRSISKSAPAATKRDPLNVENVKLATTITPGTARVERGPDGRILRVIHAEEKEEQRGRMNPLGDPLNEIEDEEMDEENAGNGEDETGIVGLLRDQVKEAEMGEKKKRKPSKREGDWIEALIEKWGEDYKAMSRDRRLNERQQTEGEIRRRVKLWKERGVEGESTTT